MIMRRILILLLFSPIVLQAQVWKNKEKMGKIHFFSSTPMENIEAKSQTASSILNSKTDSVLFLVVISSFEFPNALMQEHFNENYMESNLYPKAMFRGKMKEDIDFTKDGEYTCTAAGNLTLHGISKPYTVTGKFTVKGGEVRLVAKFNIKLADHDVKVPKLVTEKIAQEIATDVDVTYAPYVKK
jgi:polyisoprenoid-binding protein YceI